MRIAGRGFTLLEVLIALAIFVLAAVVLGASYLNVLNAYASVESAAQRDEELRFARQMIFFEPDLETVEEGGEFETADGRRVRWEAQVEPTEVADLFEVTFICERTDAAGGGQPTTVAQTFRLLRPTWSEANERDELRLEAANRIREMQGKLINR